MVQKRRWLRSSEYVPVYVDKKIADINLWRFEAPNMEQLELKCQKDMCKIDAICNMLQERSIGEETEYPHEEDIARCNKITTSLHNVIKNYMNQL